MSDRAAEMRERCAALIEEVSHSYEVMTDLARRVRALPLPPRTGVDELAVTLGNVIDAEKKDGDPSFLSVDMCYALARKANRGAAVSLYPHNCDVHDYCGKRPCPWCQLPLSTGLTASDPEGMLLLQANSWRREAEDESRKLAAVLAENAKLREQAAAATAALVKCFPITMADGTCPAMDPGRPSIMAGVILRDRAERVAREAKLRAAVRDFSELARANAEAIAWSVLAAKHAEAIRIPGGNDGE